MFPYHHFLATYKPVSADVFILNMPNNAVKPDIRQLAVNAGWNGVSKVFVNITAPLINTLNLPSTMNFPGGLEIFISSATRVGGRYSSGNAITVQIPVTIDNLGIISGGGGSGGPGGYGWISYNTSGPLWCWTGDAGIGQGFADNSVSILPNTVGTPGSYVSYNGPVFGGTTSPWAQGGEGGTGGAWGVTGWAGGWYNFGGTIDASGWVSPAAGSPPGYYVLGNSNVTWKRTGTRLGRVG